MAHQEGPSEERAGRILVLGVGNPLRQDDGFGIHVVRRLEELELPAGVDLLDGGTGGVDLLDAMRGYSRVVLLDLIVPSTEGSEVARPVLSRPPSMGEVVVFRFPAEPAPAWQQPSLSLHQASLQGIVALARALEITLPPIDVVGLVSDAIGWSTDLSPRGALAVERAVERVGALLAQGWEIPSRRPGPSATSLPESSL